MKRVLVALLGLLLSALLSAADEGGKVVKGFDGRSFRFRSELKEAEQGIPLNCREYLWRFPSPKPPGWKEAEEVLAYYYCPTDWKEGDAPRPAVVCMHILGGDASETKLIATAFASRGIPAVVPLMPIQRERLSSGGQTSLLRGSKGGENLARAFLAIVPETRRTVDLLLTRPEVDPRRIHLMGISLGGIMAATVAEEENRFDKAAFLLAGGDLSRLLQSDRKEIKPFREALDRAGAKARPVLEQILRSVDPVTKGGKLRPKTAQGKIRMINVEQDEVIPRESTLKLAKSIGLQEKDIQFLPGLGHYTAIYALPTVLDDLEKFFRDGGKSPLPKKEEALEQALPEVGVQSPLPKEEEEEEEEEEKNSPQGGAQTDPVFLVFNELMTMCRWSPENGKRMRLTADVVVRMGEASPISGKLSLTRGNGEQFQFSLQNVENLPMGLKDLRFGYGEYPWICSKSGKVYAGTLNPGSSGESLISKWLDPQWKGYQQMVPLLLPALLSANFGTQLDWKDGEDGLPILLLSAPKQKIQAELQLSSDRKTPRHLSIDGGKWTLEATIEEWATSADPREGEFAPPSGAEQREVDSQQLAGAMAAALNFLLRIR